MLLRVSSSLTLAVFWVYANHANHAAPMDDFALHANFLDRCSNLHFTPFPSFSAEWRVQKPAFARERKLQT